MKSSREIVRALMDATSDAVVIADMSGRIGFISARAELMFGYRRGDLVGQTVEILVPTRLRGAGPRERNIFAFDSSSRTDETFEVHARHSDGSEFPVEIRLTPISTIEGTLVLGSVRNVATHRRLARQTILLLEGSAPNADLYCETLASVSNGVYVVERHSDCGEAVKRLRKSYAPPVTAILIDLMPADSRGIDRFDALLKARGKIPILIICDSLTEASAKRAVQLGASDFLVKEHLDGRLLVNAISRMTEHPMDCDAAFDEREIAHITLNAIEDAVISCDLQGDVIYLNPVAETMTGWSQAESLNRPLSDVLHLLDGHSREPLRDPMLSFIANEPDWHATVDCLVMRRGGVELGVEFSIAPIYDRRGRLIGATIVLHDVSTAHVTATRMTYLAEHDVLTGLPNRLVLSNRLPQAIALAERNERKVALLFLDLDDFKQVNDSMGHLVGDALLKSVANRLLASVRKSDMVCRLSGDEFVVLLSDISQAPDAIRCADKIIAVLQSPFDLGEQNVCLTASIGISVYPDHGNDAITLLRRADKALFRVKNSGRNHSELSEPTGTFQSDDWDGAERRLAAVAAPPPGFDFKTKR